MDSYRLIVTEDRFNTSSSGEVLRKLLDEIFPEYHKPKDDLGFMYEETDTFPKEYYFITSEDSILKKIAAKYTVEQSEYPGDLVEGTPDFVYLGNGEFFTPSL